MNRTRKFCWPPESHPEPPDVLNMTPPPERLERRETAPTGRFDRILEFGTMVVFIPPLVLGCVWLIAFVAARAVRFALGF